jgi:hypothetical protein
VVGVHVEVDLDQRPAGDPAADLGVPLGLVAARQDPAVDRFQGAGDIAPAAPVGGRLGQLIGTGEEPLQELGRRRRRDRPGVEPAEDDLDEGAGKVATLSECEWRSAAEETLGANGSWTWTMSRSLEPSRRLTGSPAAIETTSWPREESSSEIPST